MIWEEVHDGIVRKEMVPWEEVVGKELMVVEMASVRWIR